MEKSGQGEDDGQRQRKQKETEGGINGRTDL